MRIDWVPFSASSLVAGATMLSIGSLTMPSAEDSTEMLTLAQEEGGRWLAVSGLYFVAAVLLTVGLPSILVLFDRKGARVGLTAISVFTIGCVGTAGYAMILSFFRALVVADALDADALDAVASDNGFAVFLFGWIGAFYLGELLLGIALLMAKSTPRWIPGLLILHVALFPLSQVLPSEARGLTVLLITVALSGVAIHANTRHVRVA